MVASGCRWLLSLVVAFMVVACAPQRVSDPSPYQGYVSYEAWLTRQAAVQINVICPDGGGGGSGSTVSDHQVVTARHVAICDDGSVALMTVETIDGAIRIAQVERWGPEGTDVVLLRIPEVEPRFKRWLTVSTRKPLVGEELCWIGRDSSSFPPLKQCGPFEGTYSGVTDEYNIISAHGVPGNSGSGIFDSGGRVLGVLSRGSWHSALAFFIDFVPTWRWGDDMLEAIGR